MNIKGLLTRSVGTATAVAIPLALLSAQAQAQPWSSSVATPTPTPTPTIAAASAPAATGGGACAPVMTVSPDKALVFAHTGLTLTGTGCLPDSHGHASVTLAANSIPAPAPVAVNAAVDGTWSARLTLPTPQVVGPVTVTGTCTGMTTFAYPPRTLTYLPSVAGDGFDVHPMTLPGETRVHPGARMHVHSTGWAAGQHADLSLDAAATNLAGVTADSHGVIDTVFAMPVAIRSGKHTLHLNGSHSTVTTTEEIDFADFGTVDITVVTATFTTVPTDTRSTEPSTLANTGTSVTDIAGIGLALIVAGAGALFAGGRRERTRAGHF